MPSILFFSRGEEHSRLVRNLLSTNILTNLFLSSLVYFADRLNALLIAIEM